MVGSVTAYRCMRLKKNIEALPGWSVVEVPATLNKCISYWPNHIIRRAGLCQQSDNLFHRYSVQLAAELRCSLHPDTIHAGVTLVLSKAAKASHGV